jgi:hypothetical protein
MPIGDPIGIIPIGLAAPGGPMAASRDGWIPVAPTPSIGRGGSPAGEAPWYAMLGGYMD